MAHLTAEQIRALNGLKEEEKASLLETLTGLTQANDEITRLRKSQPTDAQQVVEKVKWTEMEKAVADRDVKIKEYETKLAAFNLPPETFGGAFAPIFELFS